jgi:nicotinamidase-related amidase
MTAASDTALLVIDAQESFRARADDWAATANPGVLDNIALLVEHARASGDAVVWITHADPGSGGAFDPAGGLVRVMTELDPHEAEPVLTKTTISPFASTDLHERLEGAGIRRVVICGIRTEQCCETTARMAGDLGFDVEFVNDATTTSDIPADGALAAISGEEIMRRTESVLSARGFARITDTQSRIGTTV